MNVGILTYAGALNYGAQAQLYAMSNYLKEKGHNVTILMFKPHNYTIKNMKISLRVEPNWEKHPIHVIQSVKRMKGFYKWIKKIQNKVDVKNGSEIDDLLLDLVVVGSDEIVNCIHPFFDDIYMGKGIIKTPMIYYAPSAGALPYDYVLTHEQMMGLKRFMAYSTRDMVTKAFFENNISETVTMVLDPTFLWEFSEVQYKMNIKKKYILLYSFDSISELSKEIAEYANKYEYEIVSIAREYKWADINMPAASEEEWITCFRNCEVVITDSFHGLVFALKNKKKVVLISRGDKLNKNSGLLEFLGIQINYYKNGAIDEYLKNEEIDYAKVCKEIEKRKNESEKYLSEAINNI